LSACNSNLIAQFSIYGIFISGLDVSARTFICLRPLIWNRLKRANRSHACALKRSGTAASPGAANAAAIFHKASLNRQDQPCGRMARRDPGTDVLGGADCPLCLDRVVRQLTARFRREPWAPDDSECGQHISRASWISSGLLPQAAQEDAPVLCRFAGAGVSLVFMESLFSEASGHLDFLDWGRHLTAMFQRVPQ
jgi:hypothetical protein